MDRLLLERGDMSRLTSESPDGFVGQAIEILGHYPLLAERLAFIRRSLERRVARIVDIREWC